MQRYRKAALLVVVGLAILLLLFKVLAVTLDLDPGSSKLDRLGPISIREIDNWLLHTANGRGFFSSLPPGIYCRLAVPASNAVQIDHHRCEQFLHLVHLFPQKENFRPHRKD